MASSRSCPGYCGDQDRFYICKMKGVEASTNEAFIDTYTARLHRDLGEVRRLTRGDG